MKSIKINLRNNKYEVIVGSSILEKSSSLQKTLQALTNSKKQKFEKNAYVLFDKTQTKKAMQLQRNLKKLKWKCDSIKLNAGENLKNIDSLIPVYNYLLQKNANRRSVIFALGGGTVGDAIGFVAGTYMRGMGLVYVPTTLLSQVDSSLGGKCGVNLSSGKNLVGIFNQPDLVLCDLDFLQTLDQRDMISGLGELVKMGLLFDLKFYNYLKNNYKKIIKKDLSVIEPFVAASLALKAKVVEKDEFDLTGHRELLNLGHTFAHAIEKVSKYGTYRHGEAVILGIRAELRISVLLGLMKQAEYESVESFLKSISIPKLSKSIKFSDISKVIQNDKKKVNGKTRFVLLQRIGKPVLTTNVPNSIIKNALDWIQK